MRVKSEIQMAWIVLDLLACVAGIPDVHRTQDQDRGEKQLTIVTLKPIKTSF